jgi:asparagine synthase (glutamine-hydrolysing)
MGRLYYRDELRALLREQEAGDATNDAALVLTAYAKLGVRAFERLEGDFCLVLWDPRERILFAARDLLGGFPLFWTKHAGQFILGTGILELLGRGAPPRLNSDFVADYLMRPISAIQEMPANECIYQGVHRVVPGSIVELHVSSGEVRQHQYWDWVDRVDDPGTDKLEDIADQFDERFRRAVRERIRGTTAAHLSGGMDSTAVALVARNWIQSHGDQSPLHALSIVYERLGTLAGEAAYIESALSGQHGIVAHRILGDDILAYDSFVDSARHDEPTSALFDSHGDHMMIDAAAAVGAETILTGLGGDAMLDVFPFHIAGSLRRGRVWAAWREACRWARARQCDPWHLFYHHGVANLLPVWSRVGIRTLLRGGRADWNDQRAGAVAPWIRPEFTRSHNLFERGLRNLRWLYGSHPYPGLSIALATIQGHVGDFCRWSLAARQGILISHPFNDPRILRLGLGIQLRFRQDPEKQKPLLAHAMRDVLPEKIRQRRAKGDFNEPYYKGLARHLPRLMTLINGTHLGEMELFDKKALTRSLQQSALGIEQSANASIGLDSALCLIKWLAMRQQWEKRAAATPTFALSRSSLTGGGTPCSLILDIARPNGL